MINEEDIISEKIDWSDSGTKRLICLSVELNKEIEEKKIPNKKKMWEILSNKLTEEKYFVTASQAENKWKSLIRTYKRRLNKPKTKRCTFKYENEIHEALQKLPNSNVMNNQSNSETNIKVNNQIIKTEIKKRRRTIDNINEETSQQPVVKYLLVNNDNPTNFKEEVIHKEMDAIDSFLASLSGTIKKLTPYHQNIAKMKIFTIVSELELQELMDKEEQQLTSLD